MIRTIMKMKPSHRPRMSMTLAMASLLEPPTMDEMTLTTDRRPCWPNDEVMYGSKPPVTAWKSVSTKLTRYSLPGNSS